MCCGSVTDDTPSEGARPARPGGEYAGRSTFTRPRTAPPRPAAADAHRHHDVLDAAPLALDQRMAGQARAAHAVGVADRDRAAVDVELVVVDAEPVAAVDHLHGEGLVQLPEADVVDLEAVRLEELRHGEHRADAHLVRIAAGDRDAAIDAERREVALARELRLHQHAGAGAVGKLRGVAGGDEGAGLQLLAAGEHRLQRRKARERRVGARALVLLQRRPPCRETAPVALSATFITVGSGAISASNRPAACAAAVRCCDCSAYSSCASREIL